ncbi:MAG: hydrogenase maturation protease [Magnetococcales bacterium]|nr:hydrogenase maturation protease [Magnetococcales bacterium]NGZ04780.1 hydrogenase maturation protease [Magnetococcales bacterium]
MGCRARILCLGNRLWSVDDIGPRVFDVLSNLELPSATELIDGGVRGLDLLYRFEGVWLVVIVDTLNGFGDHGAVIELTRAEVANLCHGRFDHVAGLPYLMHILPQVCDGPVPVIRIIGAASGSKAAVIEAIATRCVDYCSQFAALAP